MRYLPHTDKEISEMLDTIGKGSLDDLFCTVPEDCRYEGDIEVGKKLTEWQLEKHFEELADKITVGPRHKVLIGAGRYDHYIPETVRALMSRSEFLTAYTPYQPEMAQGTLQGIFEYQTLTARLLGVDAANASMYDGGSALAEALLMGLRVSRKKKRVAVSKAIHPHYLEVVKTYLQETEFEIVELPFDDNGRTDLSTLPELDDIAAVAVQSPNFFGVVEDLEKLGQEIHDAGALFVGSFSEPLAYGLYKSPGECGADIVCGEGQSMGLAKGFGGASLGMFGCREKLVRNMPGRLVGQTVDKDGKRGFVLTLSTREQHIRREKATSNICSNQGVCAMSAGMYMASIGGTGLREIAKLNYDKASYLKSQLLTVGGEVVFDAPIFNEFALRFSFDFEKVRKKLLEEEKVVGGLPLGRFFSELDDAYLFCATETLSKEDVDRIVACVKRYGSEEVSA